MCDYCATGIVGLFDKVRWLFFKLIPTYQCQKKAGLNDA